MIYPDPSLPWPVDYTVVCGIAEEERGPLGGCALVAYLCPAGVWTIGWGETDNVHPGDRCTKVQADSWLCDDLTERVAAILAACTVRPNANQLAAFLSFAYNVGLGWDPDRPKPKGAKDGFRQSTVLKRHNEGSYSAAARAFDLWNQGRNPKTGQKEELPGLVARRKREAALYLKPVADSPPMPQAVEPESKMTSSPMVQTSTVGLGGMGAAGLVAQAGEHIDALKPVVKGAREVLVDTLGVPVEWLLPMAVIVAGVLIVRWRVRQRRDGWA